MNVLLWSEVFWPMLGGAEIFAARLIRTLAGRGHEFTVVTERGRDLPERDEFLGVQIYRFPFYDVLSSGNAADVVSLRRRIAALKQRVKPALVHLNTLRRGTLFQVDTARSVPAPVLLSLHDCVPQTCGRPDTVLGKALGSAARITCCSDAVRSGLTACVPETLTRSSVVYYGVQPPPRPPAARPVTPPRLLCLGRLAEEKGFDLALRAFAMLRRRFPDTRLTIAGDGPCRGSLERLAAELKVAECVLFTGWVEPEEVWQLMSEASVVVMPSRWEEPFGLVAVEAALMERPIVAARVGGLPEAFEEGVTGLGMDREDAGGLAAAASSLLDEPDRATEIGRAGRQRALSLFGWERCADAYEREYRRTIGIWQGRSVAC